MDDKHCHQVFQVSHTIGQVSLGQCLCPKITCGPPVTPLDPQPLWCLLCAICDVPNGSLPVQSWDAKKLEGSEQGLADAAVLHEHALHTLYIQLRQPGLRIWHCCSCMPPRSALPEGHSVPAGPIFLLFRTRGPGVCVVSGNSSCLPKSTLSCQP